MMLVVYFKNYTSSFRGQGFPLQVISAKLLEWLKTLILGIFVFRPKMRKTFIVRKNKVHSFSTFWATRTRYGQFVLLTGRHVWLKSSVKENPCSQRLVLQVNNQHPSYIMLFLGETKILLENLKKLQLHDLCGWNFSDPSRKQVQGTNRCVYAERERERHMGSLRHARNLPDICLK